jgi:hypothetical protein
MQKINTMTLSKTNYNTSYIYDTMSVRIIVKLLQDIALDLLLHHHQQQQPSSPELEELSKIQRDFGIVLEPVHPGIKDLGLAPYFTVEVSDEDTANLVIERLKLCKAVDGAYIKPSDQLPGATI